MPSPSEKHTACAGRTHVLVLANHDGFKCSTGQTSAAFNEIQHSWAQGSKMEKQTWKIMRKRRYFVGVYSLGYRGLLCCRLDLLWSITQQLYQHFLYILAHIHKYEETTRAHALWVAAHLFLGGSSTPDCNMHQCPPSQRQSSIDCKHLCRFLPMRANRIGSYWICKCLSCSSRALLTVERRLGKQNP